MKKIILLLLTSTLSAQISIAVLDFEGKGVSSSEASALSDRLRNELTQTGEFIVVERDQMEEVLEEQGFQQAGFTSDDKLVEAGKLIGVEQMIAGSISKVGNVFTVSARIISIETATVLKAVSYDHEGKLSDLLRRGMNHVALELAGQKKKIVPSVAIIPLKNKGADEDEFYAYGISADLISDVSGAGLIRVASLRQIEELIDLPVEEIARKLFVRYISTGTLWKIGNMFQLSLELYDTKESKVLWSDRWMEQWESLPSIKGKLAKNILKTLNVTTNQDISKAPTTNPEAYQLYLKAKDLYARSKDYEQTEQSMELMQAAISIDDQLIAAQLQLGQMYYDNGEYDKAAKFYEQSLNKSKRLEDNSNIADALRKQGALFRKQRQYEQALEKFNEALSIFKDMNDKSSMAKTMNSIAILYYKTKRLDEALEYWLQAYSIAKEFDDKLKISKYVNNIGIWYWKDYDYSKAIDYYNKSLLIKEELDDTRNYGKTLNNMGQVYYDMGDFSSSIEYFNQSIELKEKLNDKKGLQATLLNLGEAYFDNDDYDNALSHFRKSLNIARAFGDIYNISDRYTAIGMTHFNLANYDSATYYLTMADSIYIEYPVNRLTILSWLAITSIKDGNTQRATAYVNELEKIFSSEDPMKEDIIILNWNMYKVHQLLGNTKTAKEYLENSYLELKYRSKNIKDKKDREKYLSVKLHQDIISAWGG